MDERSLRQLLEAALPTHEPSEEFTGQVMTRIRERPRATRRWRLAAAVLLVATVVGAAGWGGWEWHQTRQERQRRAAVVELQRESVLLARELQTLRQRLEDDGAVVYLGGSERVDVVLDLASLPMTAGAEPRAITRDDDS